ncbi:uncharacterized protein [Rhodnius prolixus]|uniref:uncharacterized protein n=1 Tax=Rhodnius prolixus TaxID=13249 RepID=UPI003D18CD0C
MSLDPNVQSLVETVKNLIATISVKNEETKSIGHVNFEKYDASVEDFDTYIERLTAYFRTKGVPNDKKSDLFVTLIGPKLFTLLKTLLHPMTYMQKTFEELVAILKNHIDPPPLIIPSRHTLINRKQAEGESISDYVAHLRKLAAPCKYDDSMLATMLRDVFVSGLRSKHILDRLFEEDNPSFDKTVEIALALEKASGGTGEILGGEVNKLSIKSKHNTIATQRYKRNNFRKYNPNDKSNARESNVTCLKCGKIGHKANECYANDLFCKFCQTQGHVIKVCFKKKKYKQQEPIKEILPICKINTKLKHVPPVYANVSINRLSVSLEVDTGSPVTIITKSLFNRFKDSKIRPTSSLFKGYSKKVIRPLGECKVSVIYKGIRKQLNAYIIDGNYSNLMGRDWIENLGVLDISEVIVMYWRVF